jgi:hypothetical protein
MGFSRNGWDFLGLDRFSRFGSNGFQRNQCMDFILLVFLRNWMSGFLRIGTFGFSVIFLIKLLYLVTTTGLNVTSIPIYFLTL